VAGYIATIAYSRSSSLDGLSSLGNIPAKNLLIILVGMPLDSGSRGLVVGGKATSRHGPSASRVSLSARANSGTIVDAVNRARRLN
jgi:hypothetical protein